MKKYFTFFRLRFSMGLQYRAAALAGVVTQFAWGFLELMALQAFYESSPDSFPMQLDAVAAYVWLQQAFLAFFAAWMMENEIFGTIMDGNIAYELCRPVHIYDMWFSRSVANRLSRAVLRCFPILFVALFLPAPYRLLLPASIPRFCMFLVTMALGLLVTVAFCMLVYSITFFTVSPFGVRMLFVSVVEFFSGGVIPLPFFPEKLQPVLELLPFASMQNVPFLIYSGSMAGQEAVKAIGLQVIWLVLLVAGGKLLCHMGERKAVIQGG